LASNPRKSGIFNVGTAKARSFKDICDILQQELGTAYDIEYIPNPYIGQYQFFTQANIDTTTEFLGYKPRFSLEDGIKSYILAIKRIYKEEFKRNF
jgi:ADP-L-glycero-D-manno-heptose 6-epimerase